VSCDTAGRYRSAQWGLSGVLPLRCAGCGVPRLVAKVLAPLPPRLGRTVKANLVAGRELGTLSGLAGRLPRRRIVAPPPAPSCSPPSGTIGLGHQQMSATLKATSTPLTPVCGGRLDGSTASFAGYRLLSPARTKEMADDLPDDGGHKRGSTSRNRSRPPRKIPCQEPGRPQLPRSRGRHPHVVRGAKEVAAMATTKDRLDELTRRKTELEDHDVVAVADGGMADAEVPPAAVGNEPAPAVLGPSLRERLLEPITGRWAAFGAVAWVALLGIGIAVEPQPTNPNVVDPWFLNVLGTVLVAAVVAAFAGFWRRQRWSLAASLLASGLLVVSTVACPASGHHAQLGAWWVVQLGCGLGLVTISALGLRRG
jgi:hypothetical protein